MAGAGMATSLRFLDSTELLAPRQELRLTVQAEPAGRYTVRFALPSSDGFEPLDAVLDTSMLETDESGAAQVELHAPSENTSFRVRASIGGGLVATRDFTVEADGKAAILVQSVYTGHRLPTAWAASARPGETCADVHGIPPDEGPYPGYSAADEVPKISGVPAGVPLAVTLRSGHFMFGCASVEMLPAGPEDRPQVVRVTVLDRPIELAASNVTLALARQAGDTAFEDLLAAAALEVKPALLGSSTDDVDAVLDAMREALTGTPRQQLDTARKNEDWDSLLRSAWGSGASTRLRDRVAAWLTAGAATLAQQEHLLKGALGAVDGKNAQLELSEVAGLEPEQAGFVTPTLVTWSADAADTVVLGSDHYLSISRLAMGLAEASALLDEPDSASGAAALASSLDCAALGATLSAAGSDTELAYPECDASCLSELCQVALDAIWKRGREATTTSPALLRVTAAGAARVGEAAELASIEGNWVGKLSAGDEQRDTGGPLTASELAKP
jgi:hypothetical protein